MAKHDSRLTNDNLIWRNRATRFNRYWSSQLHRKGCPIGDMFRLWNQINAWLSSAFTVQTCTCSPIRRRVALYRPNRIATQRPEEVTPRTELPATELRRLAALELAVQHVRNVSGETAVTTAIRFETYLRTGT